MKILLVSTQDYIHHPVPSRHHYIFEELANRHEIHVPHFHVSRGKERKTNLIVHEATQFPIQSPLPHYILNAPYHFTVIRKIIERHHIDLIVASHVLAGTAAITAAKKHSIPVIFDVKDWYPDGASAYYENPIVKSLIKKAVWRITQYNLDHSNDIVTVSPSLIRLLENLGYHPKLITNGVDTDLFKPLYSSHIRKELGIPDESFVIGFVGSIERFFDLTTLIEAYSILHKTDPQMRLLIVGGSLFTNYEKELKELVENLNLEKSVIFTGLKPYEELPNYINIMDVCTIPMRQEWAQTALPNKFFEYSACQKPIISTPIPDMMQIGGNNLFIYTNKGEFIDTVMKLYKSPAIINIDVSNFSWKRKAAEMESLIFNLIE